MVLIAAAVLPDLPALLDTCTLLGLEAIVEVHTLHTLHTCIGAYTLLGLEAIVEVHIPPTSLTF